jgi:methyl-accepting chemotaxis protein
VAQINKAMGLVAQVTQRNASSAEELSTTAEELSSQAEALMQLVSYFTVHGQESVTRPGAAPRPAALELRAPPSLLAGRAPPNGAAHAAASPDHPSPAA